MFCWKVIRRGCALRSVGWLLHRYLCLNRITELSRDVYKESDQERKNVLIHTMKTLNAQIKDSKEKKQANLLISQCEESL